jgi:hypothetical protein
VIVRTVSVIPPEIVESFNAKLLCVPMPKGDCCKRLWGIYQWIINNLKPHDLSNANRRMKIHSLIMEFLEKYERTKAKEEEREREEAHFTQGFFYNIDFVERSHWDLFFRLTKRSWSVGGF